MKPIVSIIKRPEVTFIDDQEQLPAPDDSLRVQHAPPRASANKTSAERMRKLKEAERAERKAERIWKAKHKKFDETKKLRDRVARRRTQDAEYEEYDAYEFYKLSQLEELDTETPRVLLDQIACWVGDAYF